MVSPSSTNRASGIWDAIWRPSRTGTAVVAAVEHQGGHPHSGEDIDEVVGVERRQQRQDGAAVTDCLAYLASHSVNGSSPAMLGAHSRTAQSLGIPQPRLTASAKAAIVPSPTPARYGVRVVVGEVP